MEFQDAINPDALIFVTVTERNFWIKNPKHSLWRHS